MIVTSWVTVFHPVEAGALSVIVVESHAVTVIVCAWASGTVRVLITLTVEVEAEQV